VEMDLDWDVDICQGPWTCPRRPSWQLTNCLGANPGGSLGAAGLLVDPSLPDGQAAKVLHPHHGGDVSINGWPLSEASALIGRSIIGHWRAVETHACMHTCTHTCTHACMHTCTHTCMHAHMHACMHACTHACMHPCTHAHMHAHMHACMHTHTHAHMHACTHTCMHTCTHACSL